MADFRTRNVSCPFDTDTPEIDGSASSDGETRTDTRTVSVGAEDAGKGYMSRSSNDLNVFSLKCKSILVLSIAVILVAAPIAAQSLTTGDVAGVVSDPSGAVVPAATVTLTSLDTGSIQRTTTNQTGGYRFTLLKPGRYSVSATKTGFQTSEREVAAAVSQVVTADLTLQVGQAAQTVQVTEAAPLLNPETSNNTPFSPLEVKNLPSAGGDITNIAFTAPGVVVNLTSGYGNFTANGLPATSNLFTVNGESDMDPYFNINNSGATNLTLGQNDLDEATIITNAYNAQFGTFSGAQVLYVTKSGTNEFHGNAVYYWNGRDMNANDFFNNLYGEGRPFSNANQWGTSLGGPIKKNKLFFLVNNEGMRFVLPATQEVTIPTPAFANAVLANIAGTQPSELTSYQKMFSLWAGAPGSSAAQAIANSSYCNSLSLAGFNPATQACAERFEASPRRSPPNGFLAPASIIRSAIATRRSSGGSLTTVRNRLPSTPSTQPLTRSHSSRATTINSAKRTFSGRAQPTISSALSAITWRSSRRTNSSPPARSPIALSLRVPYHSPASTRCMTFLRAATSRSTNSSMT